MSDLPEKEGGAARGAEGAGTPELGEPVAYVLSLYVAGSTPRSVRAIANTRALCEEFLPGRYALEVIDIYQQPALAEDADLIAIPMLIKKSPLPLRRFVGDMSDTRRILSGMGVKPR